MFSQNYDTSVALSAGSCDLNNDYDFEKSGANKFMV